MNKDTIINSVKMNLEKYKIVEKFKPVRPRKNLFTFIVYIPFVIIAVYYLFIVSPRYESRALVTILQPGKPQAMFNIESMILGSSVTSNLLNPYLLIEYIRSYKMLDKLNKDIDILKKYSTRGDFISRLSTIPNQEKFLDYYLSMSTISFNPEASSMSIAAQAFTPEDAQEIVNSIVKIAQDGVNNLNKEVIHKEIKFLEEQLDTQRKNLKNSMYKVIEFQDQKGIMDPKSGVESEVAIIYSLRSKLVEAENNLRYMEYKMNPNAPEIIEQKKIINSIKDQLKSQYSELLGTSNVNNKESEEKLNDLTAEFEWYRTSQEIELGAYKLALQNYEAEKVQLAKDQIQLVEIVSPVVPDYAKYPRVLYILVTSLIILLMIYGIVRMIITIIKEHKY
ncbi:MAG TPA: hypothetical protein DD381_10155 [Lentisphaeria bacterium]|nr:MAG: hypothetical protein A2X47_11930 [Lentisphaerae bacterium GWF2_38_69]HBM16687.1 hypothetical protein [Lentisphaeria bacterium]